MRLKCPNCGTEYDVASYPPGHPFECTCGNTLRVPSSPPPAVSRDSGLEPGRKALLFFLNLCITPIVGVVWYFVVRGEKPETARDVCTFTWIPFAIWVVLVGFFLLIGGLAGL